MRGRASHYQEERRRLKALEKGIETVRRRRHSTHSLGEEVPGFRYLPPARRPGEQIRLREEVAGTEVAARLIRIHLSLRMEAGHVI